MDKFYQVATYCKVNHLKKYVEIEGLYRVRVKKIEAAQEENEEDPKIIDSDEIIQEDQQQEE